jgi:hypothetical protein
VTRDGGQRVIELFRGVVVAIDEIPPVDIITFPFPSLSMPSACSRKFVLCALLRRMRTIDPSI